MDEPGGVYAPWNDDTYSKDRRSGTSRNDIGFRE